MLTATIVGRMASRVPSCNSRLWKIAKFQTKNLHELACIFPVHEIEFEKISLIIPWLKTLLTKGRKRILAWVSRCQNISITIALLRSEINSNILIHAKLILFHNNAKWICKIIYAGHSTLDAQASRPVCPLLSILIVLLWRLIAVLKLDLF